MRSLQKNVLVKLCCAMGVVGMLYGLSAVSLGKEPAGEKKAEGSVVKGEVNFNRDIRPILSDNCFYCHGPDEKHREAKLRLDLKSEVFKERDGFHLIKPGKLEDSELWYLITDKGGDRMPPPDSNKELKPEQIELIKRWIEQGAKWEGHWSFEAPVKPELPQAGKDAWGKHAIDRFVYEEMKRHGLKPAPRASKEVLIRRVSFDLTGLPPTLEELDAFLNDKSENAYEKMVDRYLAKPAYGERMTLAWMDAARYGDSSVFHADGPRDMWPWRNWVIEAYNKNMPFDQFTVEQIAGDLLPNATDWQKIASGFNRNHGTTDEGGAIAEEYRVEYVVDRVKTVSSVWMGISMECSQCHDHKYDPISQKEYYGFYAFFNQTTDPGMQTRNGNQKPYVNMPDAERDAEIARIQGEVKSIETQLNERKKAAQSEFEKWVVAQTKVYAENGKMNAPDDMVVHVPLDEGKGKAVGNVIDAKHKIKLNGPASWSAGKNGGAFELKGNNWIDLGKQTGDFERTDAFSFGAWIKPQNNTGGGVIAKMNVGNAYRGYDLFLSGNSVAVHIINNWPGNAVKVTTTTKLKPGQWQHVFATYDGSSKASGIKIYFDGKEQPWKIEQDRLSGTIKNQAPFNIGRRHGQGAVKSHVDDVRVYGRLLSAAEVGAVAGADPLGPIFLTVADKRDAKQIETLKSHYFNAVDKPYKKLLSDKSKAQGEIAKLQKQVVTSMVMEEQKKPRETYMLMRGHYASPDKSEVIKPSVPEVFPPLPEGAPGNRLGLAQWLVDENHPLTARVTVNRYWTMLFGKGIVQTVMDFGSQGKWPTHPELLDWLAVDFVENGWDIKRTIKQIVMSETYQQSSRVTSIHREVDPTNDLLARGSRFRLQGEFIRDNALAVSKLLVDKVGGPSTKPYQPPGLWNEVSLNGNLRFRQDKGEKLYRKSMYIYWKRSAPHPGMLIFDSPTREMCVVQRPRTNTPLQALYTLNGVQFVEASRKFAERMMKEGGGTVKERIAFAYRVATAREASATVVETLHGLYESELKEFKAHPEKAKQLLSAGESARDEKLEMAEHAAYTIIASTILNLDATLTRN